jgi:hypothetical protein
VVPSSPAAQVTATKEQQQQEDHDINNEDEDEDEEEYSPLSDNEGEKLYRDSDKTESFGAEAPIPMTDFMPCWDTWASPPRQDTRSSESRVQSGWNSR